MSVRSRFNMYFDMFHFLQFSLFPVFVVLFYIKQAKYPFKIEDAVLKNRRPCRTSILFLLICSVIILPESPEGPSCNDSAVPRRPL